MISVLDFLAIISAIKVLRSSMRASSQALTSDSSQPRPRLPRRKPAINSPSRIISSMLVVDLKRKYAATSFLVRILSFEVFMLSYLCLLMAVIGNRNIKAHYFSYVSDMSAIVRTCPLWFCQSVHLFNVFLDGNINPFASKSISKSDGSPFVLSSLINRQGSFLYCSLEYNKYIKSLMN